MKRLLRGAFVIGRRDFSATVLSKTFLFFLLGPMFPLLFGAIFGGIGASVASQREKPVVAVVASQADFDALSAARERLADAIDEDKLVGLVRIAPETDSASQQKRLLETKDPPIQAVLTGVPAHPNLTGAINLDGTTARQLQLMLADARLARAQEPRLVVMPTETTSGSLSKDRAVTGQIGQTVLFFLTLLLSTMLLSQLVEEKSNKIVEVVAAAVPIESLFVGKLFAMLAASILGLLVWTACGAAVIASLKQGGLGALPPPAMGWPGFLALTVVYFAMNYLLLGAVFLTIGAQASTVREVQTLSMPVTFAQVAIFGFAATSAASPNSGAGLAAAIFPLSSPLAMVARAAQQPDLWPHVAAILWQMLWVALILRLGAKLFRKTVLKSGPSRRSWRWWRRAATVSEIGTS
jgi:ABC-2 type transport system permease protein